MARSLSLMFLLVALVVPGVARADDPQTGPATPAGLRDWDTAVRQLMARYGLPGAALSVAYRGRVVLQHGYGYADTAAGTPVQPDSGFRLASVSKPITAVAVARLIALGKLNLGTRPFAGVLSTLRGPGGEPALDPRFSDITVADLLAHRGGWDIAALGYDPVFNAGAIRSALNQAAGAPTCENAISFMLGQPLSFDPGDREAYSNFGYCVLAATVARVMHITWPAALQKLVLGPMGMRHTTVTPSDLTARAPGEVEYYGQGAETTGAQSPAGLSLDATDGAARLVSTASDLQRFLSGVGAQISRGARRSKIRPLDTRRFGAFPPPAVQGYTWRFDGSLPGTSTTIGVVGPVTYVLLANSRDPQDKPDFSALSQLAAAQTRPDVVHRR